MWAVPKQTLAEPQVRWLGSARDMSICYKTARFSIAPLSALKTVKPKLLICISHAASHSLNCVWLFCLHWFSSAAYTPPTHDCIARPIAPGKFCSHPAACLTLPSTGFVYFLLQAARCDTQKYTSLNDVARLLYRATRCQAQDAC